MTDLYTTTIYNIYIPTSAVEIFSSDLKCSLHETKSTTINKGFSQFDYFYGKLTLDQKIKIVLT